MQNPSFRGSTFFLLVSVGKYDNPQSVLYNCDRGKAIRGYNVATKSIYKLSHQQKCFLRLLKVLGQANKHLKYVFKKNVPNVQDICPQYSVHCSPTFSTNVPNIEDIFYIVLFVLIQPILIAFVQAQIQFCMMIKIT